MLEKSCPEDVHTQKIKHTEASRHKPTLVLHWCYAGSTNATATT